MVEVNARKVFQTTSTRRIDPDYFQKQHLRDEVLISSRSDDFQSFASLGLTVDASAFYPSIEGFYGQGSLPFLRVADVDSLIDFDGCTRIPESLCDIYPTLSRVAAGDIVFTKGGSVARIGLVTKSAAASRDLIFLNSSTLLREDQAFLYLYAQTSFFNRALLRSSSQTAQPHLTVTLVRELSILRASLSFKSRALEVVDAAFLAREQALKYQATAETTLLRALGLENWKAPEPLSYIRSSRDVIDAGRLDAEHFQEGHYALREVLTSYRTGYVKLCDLSQKFTNGAEIREYQETGTPYLRIGDLQNLSVDSGSVVFVDPVAAAEVLDKVRLKTGDVLISRSGSLAVSAVVEREWESALISSHLIRLRIVENAFDPYFVAFFLKTLPGRMQIMQWSNGGVQPEISQPSLGQLIVPKVKASVQLDIRRHILEAATARQRSTDLLNAAKRAVEVAIEKNEKAAFDYLEANT